MCDIINIGNRTLTHMLVKLLGNSVPMIERYYCKLTATMASVRLAQGRYNEQYTKRTEKVYKTLFTTSNEVGATAWL